jgi:hypothetical protein
MNCEFRTKSNKTKVFHCVSYCELTAKFALEFKFGFDLEIWIAVTLQLTLASVMALALNEPNQTKPKL